MLKMHFLQFKLALSDTDICGRWAWSYRLSWNQLSTVVLCRPKLAVFYLRRIFIILHVISDIVRKPGKRAAQYASARVDNDVSTCPIIRAGWNASRHPACNYAILTNVVGLEVFIAGLPFSTISHFLPAISGVMIDPVLMTQTVSY